MRDLIIAVGQRANSKTWKNTRITWEQLSQKLSETIRTPETVEDYKHFVKDQKQEAKDHGEGGVLVGAAVEGKKVWIIDDVITAGTAIREVVTILKNAGAQIAGVLVALDRQEKGQGELSAIQEVQKELEIPVHALITMKDLMDYLAAKGDTEALAKMEAYRVKYGI